MTITDQTRRLQLKSNNSNRNSLIITINPQYSSLVYPLSDSEYETLKNSIKEDGLHYPITVNEKGEVLDGHHRYKISKELDLLPIKHEIKYFKDSIDEKKFVIDINLKRRQLNDYQKSELAFELEQVESEQAKKRQSEAGKLFGKGKDNSISSIEDNLSSEKGRVVDNVSKKANISRGTYERAKTIIKHGSEEQKERLRDGKSSIFKESEKIRRDQQREEFISQMNSNTGNNISSEIENVKLICNDFIKIDSEETIPDNSIDLILTDPPYGKEFLFLYEDLAKLAIRILKPRGSLVFLTGHIILDEVFNIFYSHKPDLKYWWPFAVKHSGHHTKIHARNIFADWKPLLWYVKGDKVNELVISSTMSDFIESSSPSKVLHDWEQSPTEAEHIIKNLTIENQTVLDPMMGIGTTGKAAIMLNRKFIGIEKDEATFKIAKIRISMNEQ